MAGTKCPANTKWIQCKDLETARALLTSGTVPPLEALELRRALAAALESNEPKEAQNLRDEADRHALEMAETLPDGLKAGFLERWLPA